MSGKHVEYGSGGSACVMSNAPKNYKNDGRRDDCRSIY